MVDVLKHFWYVHFRRSSESQEKYYRILMREPALFETGDDSEFTTVATGAYSSDIEIDKMEPADDELYFCQIGLKDGCGYRMKLPHNTGRWGVHKDVDSGWLYNISSPWVIPDPGWSFWLPPKQTPIFVAYNGTGETVTPKMYFKIMKYLIQEETDPKLIEKLNNRELAYTQLEIGGISAT